MDVETAIAIMSYFGLKTPEQIMIFFTIAGITPIILIIIALIAAIITTDDDINENTNLDS